MEQSIVLLTEKQLSMTIENAVEVALNKFKGLQPDVSPVAEPVYLTRKQACEKLNMSPVTLWKLTKEGKLQSYKLGGKIKYLESDILFSCQKRDFTPKNL